MMAPALLFHLLSLLILATGAIGGTIAHRALVSAVRSNPIAVPGIGRLTPQFGALALTGALLMLVSGTLLLASRGWADWGHTWLSVKLALFVLLFLNAHIVARPSGMKLGAALAQGPNAPRDTVAVLLRRLSIFHVVQNTGLVVLISLAVFGPA